MIIITTIIISEHLETALSIKRTVMEKPGRVPSLLLCVSWGCFQTPVNLLFEKSD